VYNPRKRRGARGEESAKRGRVITNDTAPTGGIFIFLFLMLAQPAGQTCSGPATLRPR